MPKYNLALIPISKGDEVVKCANQLSKLADKFVLSLGHSDEIGQLTKISFINEWSQ